MNYKLIGLAALFVWQANGLFAQEEDSVKTVVLQEVIVRGNIRTDPTLTLVKADYRGKVSQPKNSGELFEGINGFSLIRRGNYALEPSFRASQYEQLNVQFDGGTKALHACPNRMDPITSLVNPEEVTRIEIIKGPFSMRYGQTFGGVVNMVTNNALEMEKNFSGTLSTGYESNGNSLVNLVHLMAKMQKFDFSANFSHRNYGNYQDGSGTEIPSSFKSLGYGLKLGYNISTVQRLQLSLRQNYGKDVLHAGLPMDTKFDNSTIGSLDYKWVASRNHFRGLTAKVYHSFVDHQMNNLGRPSFKMSEAVSNVDARTYGGKLETEWDFRNVVRIFAGADFMSLSRSGSRNRLVKLNMAGAPLPQPLAFTDEVWQHSSLRQAGLFAEARYFAGERNIFTLGGRTDFGKSKAKRPDPSFEKLYPDTGPRRQTTFSGTVAYKRVVGKSIILEAAFGRGARFASIEERYISYFNIGQDPYEYIGNPFLKPEVNNQLEISYRGNHPVQGIISGFEYQASAYYSLLENYIMGVVDKSLTRKYNPSQPPVHPKVFRNIDRAMKAGFELSLRTHFAQYFSLLSEMSYVYSENKDCAESLPLTPPLTGVFTLQFENNKFWSDIRFHAVARQNRISVAFDERVTPGYTWLDWEGGFEPFAGLKIGAGISNVFDRLYYNHLNFSFNNQQHFKRVPVTEPGRNITIFVSYSF